MKIIAYKKQNIRLTKTVLNHFFMKVFQSMLKLKMYHTIYRKRINSSSRPVSKILGGYVSIPTNLVTEINDVPIG